MAVVGSIVHAVVRSVVGVVDQWEQPNTNGPTWELQDSASPDALWSGITFGAGLFVAVGWPGSNLVMTSPDGINWTNRTAPSGTWHAIAWNGSIFVAVGNGPAGQHAMSSPDGINWTLRTTPSDSNFKSVVWNGTVFCAVAASGTYLVMTSTNGTSWTGQTASQANQWHSVETNPSGFLVAVAITGTNRCMTSANNGTTWINRTIAAEGWRNVVWNGVAFMAVEFGGTAAISTSADGITWVVESDLPANNNWIDAAYDAWSGLTVIVGNANVEGLAIAALDDLVWELHNTPSAVGEDPNNWQAVCSNGTGLFVAAATTGTLNRIMTWQAPEKPE